MPNREKRRYRRIALDLPVKVTVNAIDHYDGSLLNISPGDMALKIEGAEIQPGDAVVVEANGLDVIEGRIARIYPDGFAVSFLMSKSRQKCITEKLMMKFNPDLSTDLGDRRQAPRNRAGDKPMV